MFLTILSNQGAPPAGTLAYIKVSGAWQLATVYFKDGGVWKLATPFIRPSGTWY